MKYAVWVAGLLLLLYACSRPSDPELDNPYDEQSDAFISHPDLNTQGVEGITAISAVSGGEFGSNYGYPVTEKGVCWGTSQNPTTQNSCTEEGSGNDTFVSELNNLIPDTRYYIRAYATNKAGTEYGNQQEFTTRDGIPELRTLAVSAVTETTAQSGGEISNDGGAPVTERGICWSKSQNPTKTNSCTSNGDGIGAFSSTLTSLNPDTPYFVRAYATNSINTVYGNQVRFTTSKGGFQRCGDTLTDVDGNSYKTVQIGNQCWMAENLRTSKYQNGAAIQEVTNSVTWASRTSGAWSYFNNNSFYNQPYGKLYNRYVISDTRGICPAGWRVPNASDIQIFQSSLFNRYGNQTAVSTALRSNTGWSSGWNGNNDSGFNLYPAGVRFVSDDDAYFTRLGIDGVFWTSAINSTNGALFFVISPSDDVIFFFAIRTAQSYNESFVNGNPIRCVQATSSKALDNIGLLPLEINDLPVYIDDKK